ncbi:hypothetical protein ACFXTN_042624 [Malus domestica]
MSDPARIQSTATEPNHGAQPLHTRCTATEHSRRTPIALPASSLHYHLYCLLNLLHCLVVLALFPCCTASPSSLHKALYKTALPYFACCCTTVPLLHHHDRIIFIYIFTSNSLVFS